jgi:hypothetical protein
MLVVTPEEQRTLQLFKDMPHLQRERDGCTIVHR